MPTMKPLTGIQLWKRVNSAEIDTNSNNKKDIYYAANRGIQKKISFRKKTVVNYTLSRSDYSDKERAMSWYSRTELAAIKQGNQPTIKLMRAGKIHQDTEEHCIRGLENRVEDRWKERKRIRLRAERAVFDVQAIQAYNGVCRNPEQIASYYSLTNITCSSQAHEIGLMDERNAFDPELKERIRSSDPTQVLKPQTQWEITMLFREYICGLS